MSEYNYKYQLTITRGNAFFDVFERFLKVNIPSTLKNVLTLNHYDTIFTLSEFDEDSVKEIQEFMRNVFVKEMLDENENMCDYLERFTNIQTKFVLISGDIRLIKRMSETCKRMYALQPQTNNPENTVHIGNKTRRKARFFLTVKFSID